MTNSRDDAARIARQSVPCTHCGKHYYPGLADDQNRPRDAAGKLIRLSMAERKGFCGMKCQKEFLADRRGWRCAHFELLDETWHGTCEIFKARRSRP